MSSIYIDDRENFPKFTLDMKRTHKILAPQMAPFHFHMIIDVIRQEGYDIEVLENGGPSVIHEGLQYVHNDACYPALVVIGQFVDALKSGKYDPDHTALIITQTGGGCRASNYIHLLRKALIRAGYPQVPVVSLNAGNLKKEAGLKLNFRMIYKALASCLYGDELMALCNQVRPYEDNAGDAMHLVERWQNELSGRFAKGKGYRKGAMKRTFEEIAADFAAIPVTKTPKHKVGIVGEIYVKYSPLGNNNLVEFLEWEDCEVSVPGLTGFIQYCIANSEETVKLYGGNKAFAALIRFAMRLIARRERAMLAAMENAGFRAPGEFEAVRALSKEFIGIGAKMGEGWLLTGEMAELVEAGFHNVVCAQPFGCLPNHVVGRGMIAKLRRRYPEANITPIDYDPGATRVNQENRLKLMLATSTKTG